MVEWEGPPFPNWGPPRSRARAFPVSLNFLAYAFPTENRKPKTDNPRPASLILNQPFRRVQHNLPTPYNLHVRRLQRNQIDFESF